MKGGGLPPHTRGEETQNAWHFSLSLGGTHVFDLFPIPIAIGWGGWLIGYIFSLPTIRLLDFYASISTTIGTAVGTILAAFLEVILFKKYLGLFSTEEKLYHKEKPEGPLYEAKFYDQSGENARFYGKSARGASFGKNKDDKE